jgi:hypothetical protein
MLSCVQNRLICSSFERRKSIIGDVDEGQKKEKKRKKGEIKMNEGTPI